MGLQLYSKLFNYFNKFAALALVRHNVRVETLGDFILKNVPCCKTVSKGFYNIKQIFICTIKKGSAYETRQGRLR